MFDGLIINLIFVSLLCLGTALLATVLMHRRMDQQFAALAARIKAGGDLGADYDPSER